MTPSLFLNTVLREFYSGVHGFDHDNYDQVRYSWDGVDRSKTFDLARHADYLALFVRQHEAFFATWLLLGDDVSRERFKRLILYRLLGHLHLRINDDATASKDRAYHQTAQGWQTGASALPVGGMFGALQHFENVEFDDHRLRVDCWAVNVVLTFLRRQYFLDRNGVRIRPEPGDTVIDAGACLGDTAVAFAAAVGREGRVFAFDPLPTHVMATRHNVAQNGFAGRVAAIPLALGNATRNTDRKVADHDGTASPGFSISGKEDWIPLTTIDDFVAAEKPGRVDFIKMDIEGAELAALEGAAKTLIRDRPKLAISLYHRPTDFITIPRLLATMLPDYEFHLEHYTIHQEETVLYGCPRRR